MPLLWLLYAMGLSQGMIFKCTSYPSRLLLNFEHENRIKKNIIQPSDFRVDLIPSEEGSQKKTDHKKNDQILTTVKTAGYKSLENPVAIGSSNENLSTIRKKKTTTRSFSYIKSPRQAWKEIAELFNLQRDRPFSELKDSTNKNAKKVGSQSTNSYGSNDFESEETAKPTSFFSSAAGYKNRESLEKNGQQSLNINEIAANNRRKTLEELGRKWVYNKFMNPRNYDLGKQGRHSFNRKLGLTISPFQTTLTPQDVLYATDYLLNIEKGLKDIDDIDHLMNRRIRTSGELIQMQIGIGLVRLEKTIREKLKNQTGISNFDAFTTTGRIESTTEISNKITESVRSPASKNQMNPTELFEKPATIQDSSRNILDLKIGSSTEAETTELQNSPLHPSGVRVGFVDSNSVRTTAAAAAAPNANVDLEAATAEAAAGYKNRVSSKISNYENKDDIQDIDLERIFNNLINSKVFNGALREFFGTNPLSQFMDQINPLAEITHKRRLSSMGPGGVGRENAPMAIRSIHPTHYGRICPIETPEGKNTGLVNSLTTCARVTANGFIETPFYKVYKGQVQKNAGIFYLTTEQEEKIKSAPADLSISNVGFLPKSTIPVRFATEFTKIQRNDVQFIGISPIQMISVATSLIPFLEHDDANRALMGSNMQRQAVPIIRPQRPIVGTGLEARAASDSGHVIQSRTSGFVGYVSADKIIIYTSSVSFL
jgi:DNA-directed RNA polymerase beta subunit